MKEFEKINDILDFAINQEQESVDFYNNLASKSSNKVMRNVFEQFAQEEMGHKAKLLDIQQKGIYDVSSEKIMDMKIADYIVNVKPSPQMTYQEVLVLAMNKEKAAFKLYLGLSERAPGNELKNFFIMLAQEESRHKLRFELEYDEYVLRDN